MKNKLNISADISIKKAMQKLSATSEKCLIVVDDKKRLLGTLTDGDLRRALIKNSKINSSISKYYNKKPFFINENKKNDNNFNRNILIEKNLNVIPICDKEKKVLDYLTLSKISKLKNNIKRKTKMKIIIMAGGEGTRLRPLTKVLPKPLIPLNNKPVIMHIIDSFIKQGSNDFIISLNYKKDIIKTFFETIKKNFNLNFIEETKKLGTAGSLYLLKNKLKDPFLVTNCDTISNINLFEFRKFHLKNKYSLTIAAAKRRINLKYGSCNLTNKGNLDFIEEKPSLNFLANTGMYIINPEIIKYIPKNKKYDITNLVYELKSKGKKIGVFSIDEKDWTDVGDWTEYNKVNKVIE